MPDGEKYVSQEPGKQGNYGKGLKLLDKVPSAKATSNVYTGPACDASTLKYATCQVDGTFTGTVNVEGSNDDDPLNATWFALCTPPTAAGLVALTMPIRWVRARVSGFSAGTVSAKLHGVA